MTSRSRNYLLGFVLAGVACVSLGCVSLDECSGYAPHCVGSTLVSCDDSAWFGNNTLVKKDCGEDRCITPVAGFAFCALSAAPDPKCPTANGSYCSGASRVSCIEGYATDTSDCSATRNVCVIPSAGAALCALSSRPSPRCQSEHRKYACEGTMLVDCDGSGYATHQQACALGCVSTPDGDFCATSLDDAGPLDASY